MKVYIKYILLGILLTTVISCITFEEKFYIKKDGSGNFELSIDYTEYAKMTEGINELNDNEDDELLDTEFETQLPGLNRIIGISDVTVSRPDTFIETLSFSFSSIGSLNEALCLIHEYPGGIIHPFFRMKNKKIWYSRSNYGTNLDEMSDSNSNESQDILESLKYNIIIETESEIKKVKLSDSRATIVSGASKAIVKSNFYYIDTHVKPLDFYLKLK